MQQGDNGLTRIKPKSRLVSEVLDALKAVAYLNEGIDPPAWLDGSEGRPAPSRILPLANGLLDIETRRLLSHSPEYFNMAGLDVDYVPEAVDAVEWENFLDSLWPDDREAKDALQEIFGYLLTTDVRQQKLFLIVGPKRSGKGTIARVLTGLLGRGNVAAPTLASLTMNFGMAPLIDRRLAIISDARLSGRADQAALAERLLSISGEDSVDIDRKHREVWSGRLYVRFLILTNELPRIADSSGALASRFVVLTLTESFLGREDHGLTERLLGSLPGIFNWALSGLTRLNERGRFIIPRSSVEALRDLEDLGSPVSAFVRDKCAVELGVEVETADLFRAWCQWCSEHGRDHPGTEQSFGRDLKAAFPRLRTAQRGTAGDRHRNYVGIRLR